MLIDDSEISRFLSALEFSADKHRSQKRKDPQGSPYINHPIKVARLLWNEGEVRNMDIIITAILHDTVEDTATTIEEIKELFGDKVALYVSEVTDDKSLVKAERKQMQIEHAPHISLEAKQVKLADKISNVSDIVYSAPAEWPMQRKIEYLDWADKVIAGLRGCNPNLEKIYDDILKIAREKIN
jgi:guanosine-3',5'-bis(diphosphate) 3'-pyrophosphohydrolase